MHFWICLSTNLDLIVIMSKLIGLFIFLRDQTPKIPNSEGKKNDSFSWQELGHQASLIRSVATKVFSEMGSSLSYKVGTMIEIPRAALVADEVC